MKLAQIINLTESTNVALAQEWFNNVYPSAEKPKITASEEEPGSIVVNGNFYAIGTGVYPDNLPPIHTVTGCLYTSVAKYTKVKFVGRGVQVSGTIIGSSESLDSVPVLNLSDFPRVSPATKGKPFFRLEMQGRVIIDDPSVLTGYAEREIQHTVVGGIGLLPTNRKFKYLCINDDVHSIPNGLKTYWVRITATDGQSFKGFYKRNLQLTTDMLIIDYKTPGPLMWVITGDFTAKEVIVIGPNVDSDTISKLRADFKSGSIDKFQAQEQLIDAGLTKYARL